jgi:hypothetical protein
VLQQQLVQAVSCRGNTPSAQECRQTEAAAQPHQARPQASRVWHQGPGDACASACCCVTKRNCLRASSWLRGASGHAGVTASRLLMPPHTELCCSRCVACRIMVGLKSVCMRFVLCINGPSDGTTAGSSSCCCCRCCGVVWACTASLIPNRLIRFKLVAATMSVRKQGCCFSASNPREADRPAVFRRMNGCARIGPATRPLAAPEQHYASRLQLPGHPGACRVRRGAC